MTQLDMPLNTTKPVLRYGFSERANFGNWLRERGLNEIAIEVGTHRGEFAVQLLRGWPTGIFYCVDHYQPGYDHLDPASKGDRKADKQAAIDALYEYEGRYHLVEMPSNKAVEFFQDGTVSFVYIDARHRTKDVLEDLHLWWPKLKSGGIMAGHDFICPEEVGGGWGREVQPAVLTFAKEVGVDIWLVTEITLDPWSFFTYKP